MHRFIYKEKDIYLGLLDLNEKQIMEDLRRSLVMTMEQDSLIIRLNKAVKEDIPRIRRRCFKSTELLKRTWIITCSMGLRISIMSVSIF